MTFEEILKELPTLSREERAELNEMLQALQEGVSVEELRAINAAADKKSGDLLPNLGVDEAR